MIIYKSDKNFNMHQITQLFLSVGWDSAKFPQKLYKAIMSSETVISAWHDLKLVGMMTAISDTEMNVFFPYLLIHSDYQRKGIGGKLVKYMLEQYKDTFRKILICSNTNVSFYEKYVFLEKTEEQPMMIINQ
jgi:GNAT superfamily N-acetyltransferase